jgi:hypothetical protein
MAAPMTAQVCGLRYPSGTCMTIPTISVEPPTVVLAPLSGERFARASCEDIAGHGRDQGAALVVVVGGTGTVAGPSLRM